MPRTTGCYSGSDYEYHEENGKWILTRQPCGMEDVYTDILDSEDAAHDRINEIESWFDHRSPWD